MKSAPKEIVPKNVESEVNATAFVRVMNYRDPPVIEGSVQSQDVRENSQMKTGGETERLTNLEKETVVETNRQSVEQVEEEQFNYATLSNKIILAKPENPEFDISLIVYHSGKLFLLQIDLSFYRGRIRPSQTHNR